MTKAAVVARMLLCLATVAATDAIAEQLDDRPVDAETKARVIDGVLRELEEHYVIPDKAKAMVEAIRRIERAGQYAMIVSSSQFAMALAGDLQFASGDQHLLVIYAKAESAPDAEEHQRKFLRRNFGFDKVEVLDGNIGYLDLRFFAPLNAELKHTMAAAMGFVANTDALIIDMRQNGGGSAATVAALSSYFFDQRTLINRMYYRNPERTEEFWTVDVEGPKYGEARPVFILAGGNTFSGGEEFCYDLQTRKRAIVVGEVTLGGAHPTRRYQVTETFAVVVPAGRAINPVTGTNWQGVGISPDVRVHSDKALEEAIRLATQAIAMKK